MDNVFQQFKDDLIQLFDEKYIDFNNINSFDSSIFLTLSNIYVTKINNDKLDIYKSIYNGDVFFRKQRFFEKELCTDIFLSVQNEEYFKNNIVTSISSINNFYTSREFDNINIKLINNNSIVIIEDDLSTCIFSKETDFNKIQPYINNIDGMSMQFSQLSILNISSDTIFFGNNQFTFVGQGKTLLSVDLSHLDNMQYIPIQFLEDNFNLNYVKLPDTLKIIDKLAFSNCKNLKKIIIPDSVEYINYGAFSNCENLEYVEIGENIKNIERSVFFNDYKLKYIIIKNKKNIIDLDIDFSVINTDLKVFVYDKLYNEYQKYIDNKYGNNSKYFFYKLSEKSNLI